MRKFLILFVFSFCLAAFADEGSGIVNSNVNPNPDTAGTPRDNLDPGMQVNPNPDEANRHLDPGMASPAPNQDQGTAPNQNDSSQSDSSKIWVCGQGGAKGDMANPTDANNCLGVCRSSGFTFTGVSSRDAALIKSQCGSDVIPGQESAWVACECKAKQ